MSKNEGLRVAVIGLGFSGVASACQLARRLPSNSRLILINGSGAFARGLAYGTQSKAHVLNVPVGRMSMDPDEPGHFLNWLEQRHPSAAAEHYFVSRRLYGDYLQACLQEDLQTRTDLVIEQRIATVSRLVMQQGGGFALQCRDTTTACVDRVVFALGHFAPRAPHPGLTILPKNRYSNDPWSTTALDGLGRDAPLMLIGTGLTMLDVLHSLEGRGHRGPILAVSRRGLVPLSHRVNEMPPPDWKLSPGLSTAKNGLRRLTRLFRHELEVAEAAGHNWRDVWGAFRSATAPNWRHLTLQEKAQFLRHLQPYWDVHRHRAAPLAHDFLRKAMSRGNLKLQAGRIQNVQLTKSHVRVSWLARHSTELNQFDAERIINCSGPGSRIDANSSPLLWDMHEQGLLRTCPLGLGLEVDSRLRLLDAKGQAQEGLYYVGPLLKSQHWEATAVPELRVYARQMAIDCVKA